MFRSSRLNEENAQRVVAYRDGAKQRRVRYRSGGAGLLRSITLLEPVTPDIYIRYYFLAAGAIGALWPQK